MAAILASMERIDLHEKLTLFHDHWSPRIVAALNGQEVKLAKLRGTFDWHAHRDSDELFLVLEGSLTIEFRDRSVDLQEGQMLVVPRGMEHRPVAQRECSVLLIEAAGTVNTGDGPETERSTSGTWI